MQFDAICQSKKSIKFSMRLINLLLLQRLLKIFNHGQNGLTHIVLSKKKKEKKDKTAFDLRFTYQNFYPETILSSILRKFPQKALFIFFSILHHFRKIWIRDNTGWPILSLKKVQFLSKARMVRITLHFPTYLETLDQDIILYEPYCPFKNFI